MNLTERLIAPGATRGEIWSGFGAAFAGAALSLTLAARAGLPMIAVVVIAVIGFDLYGGAVVNATGAAKRWYHRPGRTARHHLGFVAVHIQPFVLAWAVPGFTWTAAAVIYVLAISGAVIVTATPTSIRRPIAFAATAFGVTVATTLIGVPQELGWFAPLLLIKLLLAHLLPEER